MQTEKEVHSHSPHFPASFIAYVEICAIIAITLGGVISE